MNNDSSSTSCDDKSEFSENPTRDALADGLMSFLKPRIDSLFKLVQTVKHNQMSLKTELDSTYTDLDNIFKEDDEFLTDFQKYSDKIAEMRHQMTIIDNVLQSARNRLENFTGKMQTLQKSRNLHFDGFVNTPRSE